MIPPSVRTTAFLLLLAALRLPAAGPLTLRVWCELEPMVYTDEPTLPREEARRRLLAEGQEILSGMIYGYRFTYTPLDRQRRVHEEFRLEPIAQIRWGDENLRIVEVWERGKRLFARLGYDLAEHQADRLKAWGSNTIPVSAGQGEGNLFKGVEGKKGALQEAVKNAIREHLRPLLFNKPREISGEILIWDEPRTIIQAGAYQTQVSVKLRLDEITPYRIF